MPLTDDDLGIHLRVLLQEFFDNCQSLISLVGHGEYDLKFGILLSTGGFQIFEQV